MFVCGLHVLCWYWAHVWSCAIRRLQDHCACLSGLQELLEESVSKEDLWFRVKRLFVILMERNCHVARQPCLQLCRIFWVITVWWRCCCGGNAMSLSYACSKCWRASRGIVMLGLENCSSVYDVDSANLGFWASPCHAHSSFSWHALLLGWCFNKWNAL